MVKGRHGDGGDCFLRGIWLGLRIIPSHCEHHGQGGPARAAPLQLFWRASDRFIGCRWRVGNPDSTIGGVDHLRDYRRGQYRHDVYRRHDPRNPCRHSVSADYCRIRLREAGSGPARWNKRPERVHCRDSRRDSRARDIWSRVGRHLCRILQSDAGCRGRRVSRLAIRNGKGPHWPRGNKGSLEGNCRHNRDDLPYPVWRGIDEDFSIQGWPPAGNRRLDQRVRNAADASPGDTPGGIDCAGMPDGQPVHASAGHSLFLAGTS